MAEENVYHGSSLVLELLSVTIEDIMRIAREKGWPQPNTLVVVGDNTVKELKNRYCLGAMAQYINHHKFQQFCEMSKCLLILW